MKSFFSLLFTFIFFLSHAQDGVIHLRNPSFEDTPQHSISPKDWQNCGFPSESAPDVQPNGGFSVNKPAYDRTSYVGMVVRDNDTWESIGQQLSDSLRKGQAYAFSLHLAQSETYISSSRIKPVQVNYNTPCKLRIWGGNSLCHKKQLLAESQPINHHEWMEYTFQFIPNEDYQYFILEAFYDVPVLLPYNGNILVDNASPIIQIDKIDSLKIVPTKDFDTHGKQRPVIEENGGEPKIYSFTYPKTKDKLVSLIKTQGQRIVFENNQVQRSFYENPEGIAILNNPHFHIITEALVDFPGALLIIAVKGSIHRATGLKNSLAVLRGPKDKIVIRSIMAKR